MSVIDSIRRIQVSPLSTLSFAANGTWGYVRTEVAKTISYQFKIGIRRQSTQCFSIGQIVCFADGVAYDVAYDLGGHLLVVMDDDGFIVEFSSSHRQNISTRILAPEEQLNEPVHCRVLATGKKVDVSRELLVPFGECMSMEVLNEHYYGWTGKWLFPVLEQPLDHVMRIPK